MPFFGPASKGKISFSPAACGEGGRRCGRNETEWNHGKLTRREEGAALFLGARTVVRARAAAMAPSPSPISIRFRPWCALEPKATWDTRAYGSTYQYYPLVSEAGILAFDARNVISRYFENSYLRAVFGAGRGGEDLG